MHLDAIWMRANTKGPLEEMPERQIKSCGEIARALEMNAWGRGMRLGVLLVVGRRGWGRRSGRDQAWGL